MFKKPAKSLKAKLRQAPVEEQAASTPNTLQEHDVQGVDTAPTLPLPSKTRRTGAFGAIGASTKPSEKRPQQPLQQTLLVQPTSLSLNTDYTEQEAAVPMEEEEETGDYYTKERMQELLQAQRRHNTQAQSSTQESVNIIPNESQVLAAKKKRELIRQFGRIKTETMDTMETEEDFIPINKDTTIRDKSNRNNSKDSESEDSCNERMDEEDEDEDAGVLGEDYEEARLAFGTRAVQQIIQRQKREMQAALNDNSEGDGSDGSEEEEDENVLEWERQQILKGTKRSNLKEEDYNNNDYSSSNTRKRITAMPKQTLVPQLSQCIKELQESLQLIENDFKETEIGILRLKEFQQKEFQEISLLTQQLTGELERQEYYKGWQRWLDIYVNWMQEKCVALTLAETEKKKQLFLNCKRQFEISITRLNKFLFEAFNMNDTFDSSFDEDDFDSDVNNVWLEGVEQMLDDGVDEFCEIKSVIDRFRGWRQMFQKDYDDAFVELSIAGALEVFVRRFSLMHYESIDSNYDSFVEYLRGNLQGKFEETSVTMIIQKSIELFQIPWLCSLIQSDASSDTSNDDTSNDDMSSALWPLSKSSYEGLKTFIETIKQNNSQLLKIRNLILRRFEQLLKLFQQRIIIPPVALNSSTATYSNTTSNSRLIAWKNACLFIIDFIQSISAFSRLFESPAVQGETSLLDNSSFEALLKKAVEELFVPVYSSGLQVFSNSKQAEECLNKLRQIGLPFDLDTLI